MNDGQRQRSQERVGIDGEEVSLFGMQKLCAQCLSILECGCSLSINVRIDFDVLHDSDAPHNMQVRLSFCCSFHKVVTSDIYDQDQWSISDSNVPARKSQLHIASRDYYHVQVREVTTVDSITKGDRGHHNFGICTLEGRAKLMEQ